MIRSQRKWFHIRWIAFFIACVSLCGCVEIPGWFEFQQRERPRLYIAHLPLVPSIDHSVNILLHPDVDASTQIDEAWATLYLPNGQVEMEMCSDIGSMTYQCGFSLEGVEDGSVLRYSAHIEVTDSDGSARVNGDAHYEFTAVELTSPVVRLIPVRVPVAPRSSLHDTRFSLDTVLVHDPSAGNFTAEAWRKTMSDFIYLGLLADPVYRWRSNQLAFYAYSQPALVSDFYSGRDTRCGQNPWPDLELLPSPVRAADAIGVFHQRDAQLSGGDDESAGGDFRDCAGRILPHKLPASAPAEMVSFSARAGDGASARLAAHEFGHALFGLSDEYNELTATRRTPDTALQSVDVACCCRDVEPDFDVGLPGGGTSPSPGVRNAELATGTLRCLDDAGMLVAHVESQIIGPGGLPTELPDCAVRTLDAYPLQCWSGSVAGTCPSLQGQCVRDAMWLGESAPETDAVFDNLFTSEDACEAARDAVLIHPGVERAQESVLQACELSCGPDADDGPCACEEQREYWRVDRNPADTNLSGDLMKLIGSNVDHGGACARCVETSLCIRWERARGRTPAQTRDYCEAPPEDIVAIQTATVGIVTRIARWFRELFGHARTTR